MDAPTVVSLISLPIGLAGWVAFAWQVHDSRRKAAEAAASTSRTALAKLDLLVGEWVDAISKITQLGTTYAETARKIRDFNEGQGAFEAKVRVALLDLPNDDRFDRVRESFEGFQREAFDVKDGLIGDLADEAHPPEPSDWLAQRNRALAGLRETCDEVQAVLRHEMAG